MFVTCITAAIYCLAIFRKISNLFGFYITDEMGEMKGKFLVQTRAGLIQAPEFVKWRIAER